MYILLLSEQSIVILLYTNNVGTVYIRYLHIYVCQNKISPVIMITRSVTNAFALCKSYTPDTGPFGKFGQKFGKNNALTLKAGKVYRGGKQHYSGEKKCEMY